MKTITIPMHCGRSEWEEAADVLASARGLVVIRLSDDCSDGPFSLTHARSGLQLGRFLTLGSAIKGMRAVEWLMDWTASGGHVQREADRHGLGPLLCGVMQEFAGIHRRARPEVKRLPSYREALRR